MANSFTGTSTITNQVGVTNLITTAYDQMVGWALRSQPIFRNFVDKRPAQVSHPGSSVRLQKHVDLADATTALVENVDPDPVALSNTTYVDVTPLEYGNAVLTTQKFELVPRAGVAPAVANLLARNMATSLVSLVLNVK